MKDENSGSLVRALLARTLTPVLAVVLAVLAALLAPMEIDHSAVQLPGGAGAATATPSGGEFTVTGHGYGHGHGMSQYGAQGAALRGLGAGQILAFYYPGTTIGNAGGDLRVLLSADTDDDVQVLPTQGLALRTLSNGVTTTLPAIAGTVWRLRPAGSQTVLDHLSGGAWVTDQQFAGDAEFTAPGPVTLRTRSGDRAYRGTLRLASSTSRPDSRDTVNVVGLDDYTRGVVPREMPASWQPAAVQSQAVAARTYAASERAAAASRDWQICDTTSCQVYGGLSSEDPRGNAAVAATAGQVLMWQGRPVYAQFSSSSGGWLSAGSKPYLVAKPDPYDDFPGNPMHTWTTRVSTGAIQGAYPQLGAVLGIAVTARDGNGDFGGRVLSVRIDGARSDVTLSGATFRSRFGLRSDWFAFGDAPAAAAPRSAIDTRWRQIGGRHSRVGRPAGAERAVAEGRMRPYRRGAIYWSASTGAHEVFGRSLRAYRRAGGPAGALGFPTTRPHRAGRATVTTFAHGTIRVARRVTVRLR